MSSLTDKDGNSVNDSSKMAEMFNDFLKKYLSQNK